MVFSSCVKLNINNFLIISKCKIRHKIFLLPKTEWTWTYEFIIIKVPTTRFILKNKCTYVFLLSRLRTVLILPQVAMSGSDHLVFPLRSPTFDRFFCFDLKLTLHIQVLLQTLHLRNPAKMILIVHTSLKTSAGLSHLVNCFLLLLK